MFTNLAGFPPDQIRNFLYDAMLVDPSTNAAIDPMGIYNAAVNFKVTADEIDNALGWPTNTAASWIASQGLPALTGGDYVVTTKKYLGDVRDELVRYGVLNSSNMVIPEKLTTFFQFLIDNNINNLEMELTLGWPIDSITKGTFPILTNTVAHTDVTGTIITNYNNSPAQPPQTYTPVITNPAPRTIPTPITANTDIVPGSNNVAYPQTGNLPITVPAPIDQTGQPVVMTAPESNSKLPMILAIGAALAALLN